MIIVQSDNSSISKVRDSSVTITTKSRPGPIANQKITGETSFREP